MPEIAQTQIQRLVALVAWMSQRDAGGPVRYREAARRLGVTEPELRNDLQVLLDLTESYKSWLSSLSVALVAGGFSLGSRGAFRRPFRLTHDEALALLLGLQGVRGGAGLATRLGAGFASAPASTDVERGWAMGPTPPERLAAHLGLLRRARDERHKVELLYCGSAGEQSRRVVHPHQLVQSGRQWYLIAWCEKAGDWRHFRLERMLDGWEREETFAPRPTPKRVSERRDLLTAGGADVATVAFSAGIARWIREQYPSGETLADGRYLVRFPVADPRWLAREVLQYGAEAEVLEPEGLREFVRAAVG